MNDVALILAAHGSLPLAGSGCDPTTNAEISDLVHAFESHERCKSTGVFEPACGWFDEAIAAFHQGEPSFADAIDSLESSRVVVVPFFASDGYYCNTVLPAAIAKSARYAEKSIRITPPVGTHPLTTQLILARVQGLLRKREGDGTQTTVIIVGHGTKRSSRSTLSTINLAAHLRRKCRCASVRYAFLDEEPFVEQVVNELSTTTAVAIPFFIGQSSHAGSDVPRRLGLKLDEGESLPVEQQVNGVSIHCDVAVGTYPGMAEVVAARADEARRQLADMAPVISEAMA